MDYRTFSPKESRAIRRDFFRKFGDKTAPQYRRAMGHCDFNGNSVRTQGVNNALKPSNPISLKSAIAILGKLPEVFVSWEYAPFLKEKTLRKSPLVSLSGADLAAALSRNIAFSASDLSVPKEIFVFDKDLSFYFFFTEEGISGVSHSCRTSFSVLRDKGIA